MKKLNLILLMFFSFTLTSCDVVGDIFEAGWWSGIIVVVLIIALVIWLLGRSRK